VDVEQQIADYLGSLPFPADWEAWVYEQIDPQWDEGEAQRREQELRDRLARIIELYLAGDITKARYETEKRDCEDQIADLRPDEMREAMRKVESLVKFRSLWDHSPALKRKRLIRLQIVSAQVRKQRLVAIEPSPLLYPILRNLTVHGGFYSGSDGRGSRSAKMPQLLSPDETYLRQRTWSRLKQPQDIINYSMTPLLAT
jgi:hypothetical protein